jgi:hypothetical protein
VFGGNVTGWTLLMIVLVLAAYLVLLQLVVAWAHKASGLGRELRRDIDRRVQPSCFPETP